MARKSFGRKNLLLLGKNQLGVKTLQLQEKQEV